MAVVSTMVRLKVATSLLANWTNRFLLTEPSIEAGRVVSRAGKNVTNLLLRAGGTGEEERGKTYISIGYRGQNMKSYMRDNSSYETLRRKLTAINGDRTSYANKHECHDETRRHTERRAFLLDGGSSNVLLSPLAPIKHTWKFSKELCPSRGYHSSSARRLSGSMLELYSPADRPFCGNFSLGKTNVSSAGRYRSKNSRGYSSCKDPTDKPTKSGKCQTTCGRQDAGQDCCQKNDEFSDECSSTSRPCGPVPKPVPVQCTTSPCPNINDYCQVEPDLHKVKFWKLLSLCTVPILIVMSGFTYSRVMEKRKEPRIDFVDLPYLRRIVKPYPWGDGNHTLFHNPVKNPISPHGYEVEDPNALKPVKKGNTKT